MRIKTRCKGPYGKFLLFIGAQRIIAKTKQINKRSGPLATVTIFEMSRLIWQRGTQTEWDIKANVLRIAKKWPNFSKTTHEIERSKKPPTSPFVKIHVFGSSGSVGICETMERLLRVIQLQFEAFKISGAK